MLLIGQLFFLILFLYLAAGVFYLFILSIAGVSRKKNIYLPCEDKKSFAVIIPSYKEDNIIIDTAKRAATHNYPSKFFQVFVIADSLQPESIDQLRQIPVNVIPVKFDISTKARSLNAALHEIDPSRFELALVLDADNIMKDECLELVNAAFQNGAEAVQCHRTAKNKQTAVAVLDAISEEINNHLFRKGPRALGLSAALIGSGMAIRFAELKTIFELPHILANPGEDREIDLQLMMNHTLVEYVDDAIVLDEKVSSMGVFEKQRVRWLEAQVSHFRRFLQPDVKKAEKNFNYWNKFIQTLLLPRSLFILVFLLIGCLIITEWIFGLHFLFPAISFWLILMSLLAATLLIAIPGYLYNYQMLKAVFFLPVLIFRMFKALLRIRSNRTEFLHTPKTYTP